MKTFLTPLNQRLRVAGESMCALILFFVPFHAFLTVFLSQFVGHYTLLRLWSEFLLVPVVLIALWLLATTRGTWRNIWRDWLWWAVAAFVLLYSLAAVVALATHAVTLEAVAYGWLTGTRFLVFFLAVWVIADAAGLLWRLRYKLLLGPAIVVIVFGVLQRLVLPYDVLKHAGYGPDTIRPYQTIDKKTSYFRIISTLRGANPLGAYLVAIFGPLTARFFVVRRGRKSWLVPLGIGGLIVLAATYSRSAWIGAFLAVGLVVASKLKHVLSVRRAIMLCGIGIVLLAGGLVTFRHNDFVQNTFFHTDEHSQSAVSSNHAHESASLTALKQVVREPLGRGPGTAGPASVYNTGHPARIAEDYYLQVGQEVGWLGLALFVAICALVARRLYALRQDPLAFGLLTAFVGLTIVNVLSHAWADDTLAYLWWGFAGLTLGALTPLSDEAETRRAGVTGQPQSFTKNAKS